MKATELREKTDEELEQLIRDKTDDLMTLRLQTATGVVDNYKAPREIRKDIARIKTIQEERARGKAQGAGAKN